MELKPIRSIDRKNMKITFYLSEELYSLYKDIQKKARLKGYKVDFNADFTNWLSKQLNEAQAAIDNLHKN
jgi:hypothetical protein